MAIRIGCIGAGKRGWLAELAHRPDQGVELVGVCDTDAQAIERYRAKFGPDMVVATDYRELLDRAKLDAVFICTPDHLHEEHALAAIEAGCAVYLEKPMAITIEGCDRILHAARDRNLKLYVGHNMRFFPVMLKMKQLIDAGTIGDVQAIWCRHFIAYGGDAYSKDWHSEQQYTTGLLLQKGAHDIDVIHWLAGGYTRRVVGMGKLSVYNRITDRRSPDDPGDKTWRRENWPALSQTGMSPHIDVEDHSMMLMQLDNGVQASYHQCHYTPDQQRNYTIIGTAGRIENIGDTSSDQHWAKVCVWTDRCDLVETGTTCYAIPPLSGTHGGSDNLIVDQFVRYLRGGEIGGATPLDARMSVAAGCRATESLRAGNTPLDVPPPPEG